LNSMKRMVDAGLVVLQRVATGGPCTHKEKAPDVQWTVPVLEWQAQRLRLLILGLV
jgi:hypothetical protein